MYAEKRNAKIYIYYIYILPTTMSLYTKINTINNGKSFKIINYCNKEEVPKQQQQNTTKFEYLLIFITKINKKKYK